MHHSDRRHGFEEMVRQLLIATPPQDCAWLEHKGAGADGGVEVLSHRTDGRQWGYQTKFFVDGFSAPQVTQLWSSFRIALASYPALDRYIVALPVNLSGGVRKGAKSQWQKWEDFRIAAEAEAAAAQRSVTIELWDESVLVGMLSGHDAIHAGMRLYWFDDLTLTQNWFAERFAASFADLGDRYLPADHVRVVELVDSRGTLPGDIVLARCRPLFGHSGGWQTLWLCPLSACWHARFSQRAALALRTASTAVSSS